MWKVQVPLKIITFVWKLLKDSLPTMLALKTRGINTDGLCPMCNTEKESLTHLFLLCPFARAIWNGSTLSIHTSEFSNLSVHQWLKSILFNYKGNDDISMAYLQAIFTTLWSIWTYRNRVIHQGICPNPLEVILMAQSLSCRYKSTFSNSAQDLNAAITQYPQCHGQQQTISNVQQDHGI